MNWYLDVVKKYAEFSGRARRKEYWMFFLFNSIISLVLALIDFALSTYPIITSIYVLALFLPNLGLVVRRLHDTDRSGWWILIGLVPIVGGIVMLVFSVLEGQPHDNKYGPNPKAIQSY